jgi:type II restriction enzyme
VDLAFDLSLSNGYTSNSQIARILTESWVEKNIFCLSCGDFLSNYENNKPVADFYCLSCAEDYELKSKKNSMGTKIVDGAYSTMIARLDSSQNPNFFFLNYDAKKFQVNNFIVIPKHFFTSEIIEKRKPLAIVAKRAGWVGCNILMDSIPESGKIYFIKNQKPEDKTRILDSWSKTLFLRDSKVEQKGWLIDIMMCIDKIGKKSFCLKEVYAFVPHLKARHPENNFVEDKIRQQLQVLRDKGYLKFTSRGNYEVI